MFLRMLDLLGEYITRIGKKYLHQAAADYKYLKDWISG